MKLPPQVLYTLSPLVEAARGEPLLEPSLELITADEARIVLQSEQGVFTFDRVARRVRHGPTEVAGFDDVRSIDINAFPGGRGAPSWGLSLYCSFLRRIALGRTYDDGNASVLAARLARTLGCKVVAVALRR